jgi:hypothetical protein
MQHTSRVIEKEGGFTKRELKLEVIKPTFFLELSEEEASKLRRIK